MSMPHAVGRWSIAILVIALLALSLMPSRELDAAASASPQLEPCWQPTGLVSSQPISCSRMVIVANWAAITDQRRDVLDLSFADVRRILRGDLRNWSELGGSSEPITVFLPDGQRSLIAEAMRVAPNRLVGDSVPDAEVAGWVSSIAGAFALVQPQQLRLGVLALTVNGHDPYRDPARFSPLRLTRWIEAETQAEAVERLATLGFPQLQPFDPVGLTMTGELLPVRCVNHVLTLLDDYDAMFDGVRDRILAADIAIGALELPLTDTGDQTPCVETIIFSGSPRAAPAIANAGIDMLVTVGNHMKDCWGGCYGPAALEDTLRRLDQVGIATAGAGEHLAAARQPALQTVRTEQGPVSFALLGYDIIAPWYWAGDDYWGTAPLEAEYVRSDVLGARDMADHVLVGMNWGVEYTMHPVERQRALGGLAISSGASFVFGNHPHWVQAVEHFDDALIAYSFGNFIFDQNWSIEVTQGMLMELGFTTQRLLGYRVRPVVIRAHSSALPWHYRPEFVDPAGEGRPILQQIWDAQDSLPSRNLSE